MISVLVYGRNDTHGYNLHRRVALSLNCLAEVLSAEDDEILFVDYNSPDNLPTLVEALSDTLTERCRSLVRVLRVRPETHRRRFGSRTHLATVEPVARNVAARRSNPANRWLLSTNTDMIVLPHGDRTLSDLCGELPDGFYGLPRFELPEWLWEHLPRSDPGNAMAELARLGPALHLNETTTSHDEILYDAPGDFQLLLREDLFAIDGFDEDMTLGWHVDANLSKRMLLHRGSIETLDEHLAGYHCNHNRIRTVLQKADSANDLGRFFFSVERVELPLQRHTWGLANEDVWEIPLQARGKPSLPDALTLVTTETTSATRRRVFDARETKFALEYDSLHTLPFVADALSVSPPGTRVAYVGANRVLYEHLSQVASMLDMHVLGIDQDLEPARAAQQCDRDAEVFVIDLGVDAALLDGPLAHADTPGAAHLRLTLAWTFETFRALMELERARLASKEHPRRLVLVNSSAVYWSAYVASQLHTGSTTSHSRVRQGIVRAVPETSEASAAADRRALQLLRWITRRDMRSRRVRAQVGKPVRFGDLEEYAGFERGWAFPDRTGVWTQGLRSEIAVALDEGWSGSGRLRISFDNLALRPGRPLTAQLLVNSEEVTTRTFIRDPDRSAQARRGAVFLDAARAWARARGVTRLRGARWLFYRLVALRAWGSRLLRRESSFQPQWLRDWVIDLPTETLARGTLDLSLVVDEPVDWRDDQRLGLHLTSFAVTRPRALRQSGRRGHSRPVSLSGNGHAQSEAR